VKWYGAFPGSKRAARRCRPPARRGADAVVVHVRCTDGVTLAPADGDLDWPRFGGVLVRGADDFEDDGAACLVVGAEDRRSVAANDVGPVEHGLDAAARLDGVHVRGKQDGLANARPAAEHVAVRILRSLYANRFQAADQLLRDGVLISGGAVDGDEFEELLDKSVAVDHGLPHTGE
jgi:hypothetical protein